MGKYIKRYFNCVYYEQHVAHTAVNVSHDEIGWKKTSYTKWHKTEEVEETSLVK